MERKKILAAVFSSLQGLEKCVQTSVRLHNASERQTRITADSLREQARVLNQMRKEANLLQLRLASDSWDDIVRSLQVYYGLRQMVRPEIMSTFQGLANSEVKLSGISSNTVVH